MFKYVTISIFLIATFLVASCKSPEPQVPQTPSQDILKSLNVVRARFSEAFIKGDVDSITSLYVDDAIVFLNNSQPQRGKDAIRNYWQSINGQQVFNHRMVPIEIEMANDIISEYGSYEIITLTESGERKADYGKYLVSWKRNRDNLWRFYIEIWDRRYSPKLESSQELL